MKQYLGPDPVLAQVTGEVFNVQEINKDNQVEADEIVGGVLSAPPFLVRFMLEAVKRESRNGFFFAISFIILLFFCSPPRSLFGLLIMGLPFWPLRRTLPPEVPCQRTHF